MLLMVLPESALAGPGQKGTTELIELKKKFTREIGRIDDPEEIMAASAYYTGRAWEIAARSLAAKSRWDGAKKYAEWPEPANGETKNLYLYPMRTQIQGLKLFCQSLAAVTAVITFEQGDDLILEDIKLVQDQMNRSINSEQEGMGVVVSLTGGAFSMLSLTVRAADTEVKYENEIIRELRMRLKEAAAISAGESADYYSRPFFYASNNIDGCFMLVYLLNLALDPKLEAVVEPLRKSWMERRENNTPPLHKMVLGLVALAEASFPATMALCKLKF